MKILQIISYIILLTFFLQSLSWLSQALSDALETQINSENKHEKCNKLSKQTPGLQDLLDQIDQKSAEKDATSNLENTAFLITPKQSQFIEYCVEGVQVVHKESIGGNIALKISTSAQNPQFLSGYAEPKFAKSRVLQSEDGGSSVGAIISVIAGLIIAAIIGRFIYLKIKKIKSSKGNENKPNDKDKFLQKEELHSGFQFAQALGSERTRTKSNEENKGDKKKEPGLKIKKKVSSQRSNRGAAAGGEMRLVLPQDEGHSKEVENSGHNDNMFMNLEDGPDSVRGDTSRDSERDTPKAVNFKIEFSMAEDIKGKTDRNALVQNVITEGENEDQ